RAIPSPSAANAPRLVERPAPPARRSAPSPGNASADGPDNFDGMRAGTGSTAPTRRESETHHMWRPESLSTARILVPAEWHIRSPARSPLRATTAVAHLS